MLAAIVAHFERVMAEGLNLQQKHLLRRPVEKVLVHDHRAAEV